MEDTNKKLMSLCKEPKESFVATKCTKINVPGALYVAPNVDLPNLGGLLMQTYRVSALEIMTVVNKETFATIASTWKKNSKTPALLSFHYSQFIRSEIGDEDFLMDGVYVLVSYIGNSRTEIVGDRIVKFSYEVLGKSSVEKLKSISVLLKKERELLSKITASKK
jgi:hypothetical protein